MARPARQPRSQARAHLHNQGIRPEGTLYRLETARAWPQRRTLIALLDLYGVSSDARTALLDIAKGADDQGWLRPDHAELPEEYAACISFEAEADLRLYASMFDYLRATALSPTRTTGLISTVMHSLEG